MRCDSSREGDQSAVDDRERETDGKVAGILSLAIVLGSAGTAMTTHCYVADKPAGAGVGGAFFTEDGVDVFKRDLPEPEH
jgi:hypothetical protein